MLIDKEHSITKADLIGTLQDLYKEFEVKIEFTVFGFQSGWNNVLHFTTGDNVGKYGDRIPGIWINEQPFGNPYLYITSAISGSGDFSRYERLPVNGEEGIPTNQLIVIIISQKLKDEKYIYAIEINGDLRFTVANNQPKDFTNVKVYAADPWHTPLNGTIQRLEVNTKGKNVIQMLFKIAI